MTRINLVPPAQLCDQHLFAEFRELPRIPNQLASGRMNYLKPAPDRYTVQTANCPLGGRGHMQFFAKKIGWLCDRYERLAEELEKRKYSITYYDWFSPMRVPTHFLGWDWEPTQEEVNLNITRLIEMFPHDARYYGDRAVMLIDPPFRGEAVTLFTAQTEYPKVNYLTKGLLK